MEPMDAEIDMMMEKKKVKEEEKDKEEEKEEKTSLDKGNGSCWTNQRSSSHSLQSIKEQHLKVRHLNKF